MTDEQINKLSDVIRETSFQFIVITNTDISKKFMKTLWLIVFASSDSKLVNNFRLKFWTKTELQSANITPTFLSKIV